MTQYVTLSEDREHLLRLTLEPGAYILHLFGPQSTLRVQLDTAEMQTLLKALPRALLEQALASNPFFDLDTPRRSPPPLAYTLTRACRVCGQAGCVCEAGDIAVEGE